MEEIRAFIAIELPDHIESALAELQNTLKKREAAAVKWVAPGSIHLTLKFLGNIRDDTVTSISDAISGATQGTAAFQLELTKTGVFPNPRAPRVVWVGLGGETDTLAALQQDIERALLPLGFPPEARGFSPHLTLGRVRDTASPADGRRLGELVTSLTVGSVVPFKAHSVSLMRSTLRREGAIYSRLASFELRGS